MEFSQPFDHLDVNVDSKAVRIGRAPINSVHLRAAASFENLRENTVILQVGISGTTVENARKNLAAEIPHTDFDRVCDKAAATWSKALGSITADIPDKGIRHSFHAGMHQGLVSPDL